MKIERNQHLLTIADVARHWALNEDTVRRHIRCGNLPAQRLCRTFRLTWEEVWACEEGPFPRGPGQERYRAPMISKAKLARALQCSERSVERWISDGLPTRRVFGSVRLNPHDATDWLRMRLGLVLDPERLLDR